MEKLQTPDTVYSWIKDFLINISSALSLRWKSV